MNFLVFIKFVDCSSPFFKVHVIVWKRMRNEIQSDSAGQPFANTIAVHLVFTSHDVNELNETPSTRTAQRTHTHTPTGHKWQTHETMERQRLSLLYLLVPAWVSTHQLTFLCRRRTDLNFTHFASLLCIQTISNQCECDDWWCVVHICVPLRSAIANKPHTN